MTTVIFGAGASIPFFNPVLSTHFLTQQVSAVGNWKRVIHKLQVIQGEKKVLVTSADVMNILEIILHYHPQYNFEQIGELMDKFCSYNIDVYAKGSTYFTALIQLFASLKECMPIHAHTAWSEIPFLYRQILAEAILLLEHEHKSQSFNKLIERQTQMLQYLAETDHSGEVNLLSFNYDDCLLSSALAAGYETGFIDKTTDGKGKCLNIPTFFDAKKVIYFPHGQLRWNMNNVDEIECFDSSEEGNLQRWIGLHDKAMRGTVLYRESNFAYSFNTFITTGQSKDESLNFAPFSYFYQRMAKDILESDKLVIVGYSFGDEHVNRLMQSYIKRNKNNKVYVIDHYTEPITMVDLPEPEDITMRMSRVFHMDWTLFYDPDSNSLAPTDTTELLNLNDPLVGYGELFPRVCFYRKGYESFLQEYHKII